MGLQVGFSLLCFSSSFIEKTRIHWGVPPYSRRDCNRGYHNPDSGLLG